MAGPKNWTPVEVRALEAAFADLGTGHWHEIAARVGRLPEACRFKAHAIGLLRPVAPQPRFVPPNLRPPASTTARVCGDPLPGRSALDMRRAG